MIERYPSYKDVVGVNQIECIPSGWNVVKLKNLFSMRAGKNLTSEKIDPSTGSYLVYGGNGIRGYYKEYNTEGPCLLVGRQGALCGNIHRVQGKIWATDHAVITKPKGNLVSHSYGYYLLTFMNLNQYANDAAAQPGLSVSDIQNLPTCLPPPVEQEQISSFLDWKVSDINQLINLKRREINVLQERMTVEISNLVYGKKEQGKRKELDLHGNITIPEKWSTFQNKRLFRERVEHTETGTEQLLSVSRHYGVKPYSELEENEQFATIKPALSLVGYKKVAKGDLVMNIMRAQNGSFGISEYDGIVSPAYCVYEPIRELDGKYIHYLYKTPEMIGLFSANSYGIVEHRRRLYADRFLRMFTALPSIEEQHQIACEIESIQHKLKGNIALYEKQVQYLQELKTRLISDAVTGQIDVRGIEIPDYEYVADQPDTSVDDNEDDELSEEDA